MATEEILDLQLIKKRSVHGIATLTLRTFFIQIFTFFATFILTVLLDPATFGVYIIVSALISVFIYFSDVGLAAALVQKKEDVTEKDLSSTFTIQQTIVIALVIIGFLFSSPIANFYNLSSDSLLLLRVLIFSLLLSSLKTIPSILLERKLLFTRLVIPQVLENIIFYTIAVVLAFYNFGIASFTYAVLARGVVGLVLIYILSPWKPSISLEKETLKKLIYFGVPFQLNSILALIKDDLLIVVLGKILPFSQIGLLGWAQKWSLIPLRFFMDSTIKVTFPVYSRLQEDKDHLRKAIEKSLQFVTFSTFPAVTGIVIIAPLVVDLIPRYEKWEPALPLLYIYSINAAFAAVNTTLTNILFALGKPKIVLNMMLFWTFFLWVLTFIFVKNYGYIGVAIASAIVAASTSIVIFFVKREVDVSILKNVRVPIASTAAMLIVSKVAYLIIPQNALGLILLVIVGAITYLATAYLFSGKEIKNNLALVLNSIRSR
ncbi:MAG: oligosaccharide flippase family protein [Candidatus Curtissbacteria bacterium]|nr:oligosaccharide flippase family protein [Candidatus Curtissbacteria bacterium]